jgi:hypothetical protein
VLAAASALAACFFVAKSDRLGRNWVEAGEQGRTHVREVFERFHIPRERLRLVPGNQDAVEVQRERAGSDLSGQDRSVGSER